MYVCGITDVQTARAHGHFVLPEVLVQFRSRFDEALIDTLVARQAADAMQAGLISPAHLVVDTFPSEQGSQRVNDAATLYTAQKNPPGRRPGDGPHCGGADGVAGGLARAGNANGGHPAQRRAPHPRACAGGGPADPACSGFAQKTYPHQVHLACAWGYSRPVVESIIASVLCRGASRIT